MCIWIALKLSVYSLTRYHLLNTSLNYNIRRDDVVEKGLNQKQANIAPFGGKRNLLRCGLEGNRRSVGFRLLRIGTMDSLGRWQGRSAITIEVETYR